MYSMFNLEYINLNQKVIEIQHFLLFYTLQNRENYYK